MGELQATLTRIFIALESDSNGLSEIETYFLAEIGNSNGFSAQKQVISKKIIFTEIETEFWTESGNSKGFSAQKQVISKKKKKKKERSLPKVRRIFRPKSEIQTVLPAESRQLLHNFGTQIPSGRLFSFFERKSTSKALKKCNFAYFLGQWGARAPPGYVTGLEPL